MAKFICSDCDAEVPLRRRLVVAASPLSERSTFDTEDGERVHHGWQGGHYPLMHDEVLIHLSCHGTWSYQ